MEIRGVMLTSTDEGEGIAPFTEREHYLLWRIQQLEATLRFNAASMGYNRPYTIHEAEAAIERIALYRTLN